MAAVCEQLVLLVVLAVGEQLALLVVLAVAWATSRACQQQFAPFQLRCQRVLVCEQLVLLVVSAVVLAKRTMRTTNNSLSTVTPSTASPSSFNDSSTSTTSASTSIVTSASSQSVSLPDNNALSLAISQALADSLPALLSSLREHAVQNTSSSSVPLAPSASPAIVPPATVPGQSLPQSGTFGQVVPSFIPTYSTLSSPAVVSSLSPVTSSTFPPLSLGGSLGATTFSSTPPTLGSDFPVGPGYSPIPHKLVVKITGGQFVELADLLSDNIKAQDTQPQAYLEGRLLVEKKKRVVEITDIVTWVEAFSIFCLVLCNSFPSRWLDLHKYKLLIIQTAKRFRDRSWLSYDIAYRKEAAASGSTDWSRMNADLYNFHTRSPSASTSLPAPAPLLASPSSGAPAATGNSSATQYCHSWNDGRCSWPFGRCRFRHACESCDGDHRSTLCPHRPPRRARSRSPIQQKGGRRYR